MRIVFSDDVGHAAQETIAIRTDRRDKTQSVAAAESAAVQSWVRSARMRESGAGSNFSSD